MENCVVLGSGYVIECGFRIFRFVDGQRRLRMPLFQLQFEWKVVPEDNLAAFCVHADS